MKVGLIGVGNMGTAILKGAFLSSFVKPYETVVFDVNPEQSQNFAKQFPVNIADSNCQLVRECDVILLAVKPVFMGGVLEEIRRYTRSKKIISIAAGWSMDMLSNALGADKDSGAQILRVMPNTPALVGAGYTALCEETTFSHEALKWAKDLFSTLGTVSVVPERLIDAVIAVAGSSPAYVYMFIEAMADGAVKLGMPRQMAIQAAAQAVLGSAKMVLETNTHPAILKDNVCSPGGTTIEAVEALEKHSFRGAVMDAMVKCAAKNQRMTNSAHERSGKQ